MSESSCPKCKCTYPYMDRSMWVCPDCGHEWSDGNQGAAEGSTDGSDGALVVKDAHGTILNDGDSVIVIKDLKIKGSSSAVKGGTKVKQIRLQESSDGHNISCKIEGFGSMNLKSEYVKKSN
jgi:protein PhnA